MEKLAGVGGKAVPARPVGPGDEMPPEYWAAFLDDALADAGPPGPSIRTLRLSEISRPLLRLSCRRCGRIVEIQKPTLPASTARMRSGRKSGSGS